MSIANLRRAFSRLSWLLGKPVPVKVVPSDRFCQLPKRGSAGAGGYDLASAESVDLPPGRTTVVATGLRVEIPDGWLGLIVSRSSMFAKNNVIQVPLIIDADYRGEIFVALHPASPDGYRVNEGERIGQLILLPAFALDFLPAFDLSETDRGAGGFGSTGR